MRSGLVIHAHTLPCTSHYACARHGICTLDCGEWIRQTPRNKSECSDWARTWQVGHQGADVKGEKPFSSVLEKGTNPGKRV